MVRYEHPSTQERRAFLMNIQKIVRAAVLVSSLSGCMAAATLGTSGVPALLNTAAGGALYAGNSAARAKHAADREKQNQEAAEQATREHLDQRALTLARQRQYMTEDEYNFMKVQLEEERAAFERRVQAS